MQSMWKIDLQNLEAMLAFGASLGRVAEEGTVVALNGDLGAGKTSFAQGVGAGLGIDQPIVSPTFILIAEYVEGRIPLLHADAYRLKRNEADAIGFEESVETWPGVSLVEWATNVEAALPDDRIVMDLRHTESGREACIQATGSHHATILQRWKVDYEG